MGLAVWHQLNQWKRRLLVSIIIVMLITAAGLLGWRLYSSPSLPPPPRTSPQPQYDIHAEIWTKNGYDGASYEFKVNCGPNYATLEECFLWDLTRVMVTNPDGKKYELAKDFNIQDYSGEVTRRWVLYGPANAGFLPAGTYTFGYIRGNETVFTQEIDYRPAVISYPTNIFWRRERNDLIVSWTPPEGMQPDMFYKVIVFRKAGQVISQSADWKATEARLKDMPLIRGEQVEMNVSSYFEGGYAYPKSIPIVW